MDNSRFAIADFDRNGFPDIAIVSGSSTQITLLLQSVVLGADVLATYLSDLRAAVRSFSLSSVLYLRVSWGKTRSFRSATSPDCRRRVRAGNHSLRAQNFAEAQVHLNPLTAAGNRDPFCIITWGHYADRQPSHRRRRLFSPLLRLRSQRNRQVQSMPSHRRHCCKSVFTHRRVDCTGTRSAFCGSMAGWLERCHCPIR